MFAFMCYNVSTFVDYNKLKQDVGKVNKTLVIMAAGLATRYGGGKQTAAFGPNGEILMEYSIADAKKAGFNRVVIIVSKNITPLDIINM